MMSKFWQNWLYAWCVFVGLLGLLFAGAGFDATDAPARLIMSMLNASSYAMTDHLRFALGLTGALTMGLAALYYAAFQVGFSHNLGKSFWRGLLTALLIWYVVDSVISLANGFGLNVLSNTIILIAFIIPFLKGGLLK